MGIEGHIRVTEMRSNPYIRTSTLLTFSEGTWRKETRNVHTVQVEGFTGITS